MMISFNEGFYHIPDYRTYTEQQSDTNVGPTIGGRCIMSETIDVVHVLAASDGRTTHGQVIILNVVPYRG